MVDVVQRIIKLLEDHVHPDLKRPFYDGDPIAIPASKLPTISVEMTDCDIDEAATGHDSHLDTIMIKVIVDKRVDFDKKEGEVVAQKTLRDYIKGVGSDGKLKSNSVVGVLRNNLTLSSAVLDQLMQVNISVVRRGDDTITEEAWISLTTESIVDMSERT